MQFTIISSKRTFEFNIICNSRLKKQEATGDNIDEEEESESTWLAADLADFDVKGSHVHTQADYNNVPPPLEHIVTNPRKVKVLIAGTSLTAQTLSETYLGYETNTIVHKMKLFTISGGPYRPELNLVDKLTPDVCESYDLVLIESGVNEIINLCSKATDAVNHQILKGKVKELVSLAKAIAKAGTQVVLLKRIIRLDRKVRWNSVMDKLMDEEVSSLDIPLVKVKDLAIRCIGRQGEEDLFGKEKCLDRIHLRGSHGWRVFTDGFVHMLRSMVLTKVLI